MSSAYLRLLIFLPAILIPACASSGLAFRMMYSAYKLNKQGEDTQPHYIANAANYIIYILLCCHIFGFIYLFLSSKTLVIDLYNKPTFYTVSLSTVQMRALRFRELQAYTNLQSK